MEEVPRRGESLSSAADWVHDKRKPLVWTKDDFNLTALINSVERDIYLLEEMEKGRGSHGGEMRNLDLPPSLPTAQEILTLPGYRQKNSFPLGT